MTTRSATIIALLCVTLSGCNIESPATRQRRNIRMMAEVAYKAGYNDCLTTTADQMLNGEKSTRSFDSDFEAFMLLLDKHGLKDTP